MKATAEIPFSRKLSFSLLSLILIAFIFYIGQHILIPLLFSILLATLLLPLSQFLQRIRINRVLSIVLSLILASIILASVIYFLTSQIAGFLNDMPTIESRLLYVYDAIKVWIYENFSIAIDSQEAYVKETIQHIQNGESGGIVGKTFFTLTGIISWIFLVPIYTFLILNYQDLIRQFLIDVFKNSHEDKVKEVLRESLSISQLYIIGLLTEMVIVFALNAAGFFIFGIKYALFMGLLAAILNIIPYVGMIIANVFCMLITLVACDSMGEIPLTAVVLIVVHLIDNSFIMPVVVGSRIRVNALAIIIGVLVGGALFGVFGMFLAIPGLAVLKVLFDRVEGMEPYGRLLGDVKTTRAPKKIKLAKAA
jgi:predicted PurR-regulated permease PerM